MSQALLKHVQESSNSIRKDVPKVRPGNRVRVHQKIQETTKDGMKERIQLFEGLVISVSSGGNSDKTFTVRKIAAGVGVEKIFPLHSKNVAKIEILSQAKVRRSKLYFMRERTGKSARLKDAKMLGLEMTHESDEVVVSEEAIEEAIEAAKAEEAAAEAIEAGEEVATAEEVAEEEAPKEDETPSEDAEKTA